MSNTPWGGLKNTQIDQMKCEEAVLWVLASFQPSQRVQGIWSFTKA